MIAQQEAEIFYNELLNNHFIEKNDNIHNRITEVSFWRNAFVTIIKHTQHFGFKISNSNQKIWKKTLNKHGFSEIQIAEILTHIS